MKNFLGVKCSRKALRLDENITPIASKLADKLSSKPFRKYAKVHPAPPPLNPLELRLDEVDASKSKSVRVVVTRKQLKQMLKNAEALKSMGISVQFPDSLVEKGVRSPRWRPTLATIAE